MLIAIICGTIWLAVFCVYMGRVDWYEMNRGERITAGLLLAFWPVFFLTLGGIETWRHINE